MDPIEAKKRKLEDAARRRREAQPAAQSSGMHTSAGHDPSSVGSESSPQAVESETTGAIPELDEQAQLKAEQIALGMRECARCGGMFVPDRSAATACDACSPPASAPLSSAVTASVDSELARPLTKRQQEDARREAERRAVTWLLMAAAVLFVLFVAVALIRKTLIRREEAAATAKLQAERQEMERARAAEERQRVQREHMARLYSEPLTPEERTYLAGVHEQLSAQFAVTHGATRYLSLNVSDSTRYADFGVVVGLARRALACPSARLQELIDTNYHETLEHGTRYVAQIELLVDPKSAGLRDEDTDVYAACLVDAGRIERNYKDAARRVVVAFNRLSSQHGLRLSLQSP